ncbi:MAG: nucleotide exchange factor GrpE [Endozoicomonas sp.]
MTVENGKPEEQVAEEAVTEQVETQADAQEVEGVLEEEQNQDIGNVLKEIEELNEELNKARDTALRAQAEMQNIKRRAEQDVEKAHKFALEKFVDSLIPVVDSLEKGIESAEQSEAAQEALLEGMNLTLKQFLDALARFSVEQVSPEGQPFDPNFHQAMSMVPNQDLEANTVMNVFQKGYTLNGRLIRPAMVVVSS